MAEVRLNAIGKAFKDVRAVDDLSFTVGDGEFLVLLGPTGAGKTTTLRLVAGIETPDRGSIFIGGRDVTREPPAVRDVAFVFQHSSLYPHRSVYDNLAFPLRSPTRRVPEDAIRAKIGEVARLLHIEAKLQNRATELSGGQMQRVAIGRALVRSPSIYLMDEPLSSLDAKLRAELRLELKHIQQDLGATILYVTNDQTEAMTMASRIGVIDSGRLIQIGSPREIYENPVNAYVASRLGQPGINLVPASLFRDSGLPRAAETLGLRTEHLALVRQGPGVAATVTRVEHLGDQSHIHLDVTGQKIVTLADPDSDLDVGDLVGITVLSALLFDGKGERVRA
jgi:multiple sugar transport system ATP-binding protein